MSDDLSAPMPPTRISSRLSGWCRRYLPSVALAAGLFLFVGYLARRESAERQELELRQRLGLKPEQREFAFYFPSHLHLFEELEADHREKLIAKKDVEQLGSIDSMIIRNAYAPKSMLPLLPTPPSVRRLTLANYLEACSETCVFDSSNIEHPDNPELFWLGEDLAFLRRMPNLRELRLRAVWLGPGCLEVIASLPKLEVLKLELCYMPCEELPHLTALKNLRSLEFYGSYYNRPGKMTDPAWLSQLSSLEELYVLGGKIDARLVECLAALPRLQTLRMDYSSLDAGALGQLDSLKQLRILTLKSTGFPRPPIDKITLPPLLEWIDLRDRQFGKGEAEMIVNAVPKQCEICLDQDHLRNAFSSQVYNRITRDGRPELEIPVEY